MIDESADRQYQAGRAEMNAALSAGFRRLYAEVRKTSQALNRIEFSAPWARHTDGCSD